MTRWLGLLLLGALAGCGLTSRNPSEPDDPTAVRGEAGADGSEPGKTDPEPDPCDARPLDCDGGCPTPDETEAEYADYCERFAGARVARSATTCGGARVYAARPGTAVLYCFDGRGRLVGNSLIPDVGVTTTHGVTCVAEGDEQTICE